MDRLVACEDLVRRAGRGRAGQPALQRDDVAARGDALAHIGSERDAARARVRRSFSRWVLLDSDSTA
jgi:hypothetical protein